MLLASLRIIVDYANAFARVQEALMELACLLESLLVRLSESALASALGSGAHPGVPGTAAFRALAAVISRDASE
ncbi:MAG: hypothetical protein ACK42I_08945, partial [Thermomicrobium sp.]